MGNLENLSAVSAAPMSNAQPQEVSPSQGRSDDELLAVLNEEVNNDLEERYANQEKREHLTLPEEISLDLLTEADKKAITLSHKIVQAWKHVLEKKTDRLRQSGRQIELDATGQLITEKKEYTPVRERKNISGKSWFRTLLGESNIEEIRDGGSGIIEPEQKESFEERSRKQAEMRNKHAEDKVYLSELEKMIRFAEGELERAENQQADIEDYIKSKQLSPALGEEFLQKDSSLRSFIKKFTKEAEVMWQAGEKAQKEQAQ